MIIILILISRYVLSTARQVMCDALCRMGSFKIVIYRTDTSLNIFKIDTTRQKLLAKIKSRSDIMRIPVNNAYAQKYHTIGQGLLAKIKVGQIPCGSRYFRQLLVGSACEKYFELVLYRNQVFSNNACVYTRNISNSFSIVQ